MSESGFITSVEAYLTSAGLTPVPASIGVAEPDDTTSLPAVVISLEETHPEHPGVGERSQLMTGALRWSVTIDLANPVLADPPPLTLLDETRATLILPHGGQVRSDGTIGALSPADISITVSNGGTQAYALTAAAPSTATEFAVDPTTGTVTFGGPLPATGALVASYVLGQWEQRLARIAGVLRVDVCGASVDDARGLGDQVLASLAAARANAAISRLYVLTPVSVSSVGAPDPDFAGSRRRTLRFAFDFESEINQPDSSGGIIRIITLLGGSRPPNASPKDSDFLI